LTSGADHSNTYADRARAAAQANAEAGAATARQTEAQLAQNAALQDAVGKWSAINTNISSTIDSMKERLEFITGGGGLLLQLEKAAEDAMNEENWDGAKVALDNAKLGAIDLDLELGNITTEEAQAELEKLGYGPEQAKAKVEELQSTLFALVGQDYLIDVYVRTHGSVTVPGYESEPIGGDPRGGSRIGGETEYATGTGGWLRVPGAPGQPVPVTVHGGEMLNVVNPARGQSAGGNTVNWFGDANFMTSDAAFDFLEQMSKNNARNAASMAAGGAYIG